MQKKAIKKVDNYRLMKIIGKGASADVYLSIDDKKKQLVAVKCMPKAKLNPERGEINLRRELEILHKMKHPNIVGIKNYLENQKNHYIMLEYCNGLDLDAYLKKYMSEYKRPLNELYIQKIMQQIAPAMEYMHLNNIIHRDIKSQNILINFDNYLNVTKNGQLPTKLTFKEMSLNKPFTIKIADLGFAKDLLKDSEGSTVLGTPMYMSPDIVMNYIDFYLIYSGF
jgi:serine/threonine protein kinase